MTTETFFKILTVYYLVVNIIASFMAIDDKSRAKKNKWRISEKTLLLVGFFGGAAGEYLTMIKIRHKTHHSKFMIGLPLEILFHIVIIALIISKTAG